MAKFNKGDVSEGILAAAMTARFLSKTKNVTRNDVVNIVKKLKTPKGGSSKGLTSITAFRSANAEQSIFDDLICKVNLAEVNMNAFLNPSIYKQSDIISIVDSAVSYSNSKYVHEWADMMYNNNQKNKIEVNSEGLLDQTGTKVDLKLIIDGVQKGVGISLKAGDVKQFGQVGGTKWESMLTLLEPLGVKFNSSHKRNHIEMLSNKQIAPALTTAYTVAYEQIKRLKSPELIKRLAEFMEFHATSGEKDVVLVQLNRAEAKVYDFASLKEKLRGVDVEVNLLSGITDKLSTGGFQGKGALSKNSIPKLEFVIASNSKQLVQIRLKMEGNRVNSKGVRLPLVVRSYVEKGPATTELIT